jgi:hypothetical protein
MNTTREPHFNGPDYDPEFDHSRLSTQIERVKSFMMDGAWRTLGEISDGTGDPHASVSAQLRHLRKERFGSYVIEKQYRGEREMGLWEYRLLPPVAVAQPLTHEMVITQMEML